MERIRTLFEHPLYREQLELLQEAERERIFCNHTLEHFLDVARMMYIFYLEDGEGDVHAAAKEVIYAAALLHDIGRYRQICEGTPHDAASAAYAGRILPECGFSEQETALICEAILCHRGGKPSAGREQGQEAEDGRTRRDGGWEHRLSEYLYRADKLSRCCFACSARDDCNWSEEKKNHQIIL